MSDTRDNHQLWNAIHIVGKTFSPKNQDTKAAFVCFFECLSDLIPDENFKKTLKSFIQQTPPDNYISSSERAFQWTYELHSYVNLVKKKRGQLATDISLNQAASIYSSITKTDWGNAFWFILHYLSANLPERLNLNYQTTFVALIMCIRFLIPCEECMNHMTNYIAKINIYPYMVSNKTAFQYTWEFHNAVSARLNKDILPFQEALNMYTINNTYSMIDY